MHPETGCIAETVSIGSVAVRRSCKFMSTWLIRRGRSFPATNLNGSADDTSTAFDGRRTKRITISSEVVAGENA